MARLGELLVAARLLEPDQVERALRAQVLWGGRLGTNLIELGLLDLDGISRALGRKHRVPAALARHFENADRELQERLPVELAQRWSVVPLLHVGPQKQIAIAVLDPLPPEAIEQLAESFLCAPDSILQSVAAEMRVRYHLERVYGLPRDARFLRLKGPNVTPFPQFDNVPVPVDTDAEVAVPIAVDDSAHPTGRASAESIVPAAPVADEGAPPHVALEAVDDSAPHVEATSVDEGAPTLVAARAVADVARADTQAEAPADIARMPTAAVPITPATRGAPIERPMPAEEVDSLARLIDEAIAQATAVEPPEPAPVGRDRRSYVRTLADDIPDVKTPAPASVVTGAGSPPAPPSAITSTQPLPALGRMAIKKVPMPARPPGGAGSSPSSSSSSASSASSASGASLSTASLAKVVAPRGGAKSSPPHAPQTLLEATRAIRRAPKRDRVVDFVIDALQRFVPSCDAAILLVVRGEVAVSWKQFSRTCDTSTQIAVPLDREGLVPTVIANNATARAAVADLTAIDEALMRSLGELRGDLVVVPIAIADKVMALIATATEPDAPVEAIESVAAAAAIAFARLIRDASR